VMDLVDFLLARIAEDEAVAHGAVRWSEGATQWASDGEPDWQHIARWDPARVLAECESKRRIVAELTDMAEQDEMGYHDRAPLFALGVLRLLALPHASHPVYRAEWTP
jgi:hypothetical protein